VSVRTDIEDQGVATKFDVVARDGTTVMGRLEANFVTDVLQWEGAVSVERFWIGNVYVVPAHRRQGVGRTLVEAAKAEGKKRFGVSHVYARISPFDGLSEAAVRAFHAAVNLRPVGQLDVDGTPATVTRGSVT
jgi:GNAT superfamily N-acetyltransferase